MRHLVLCAGKGPEVSHTGEALALALKEEGSKCEEREKEGDMETCASEGCLETAQRGF